MIAKRRTIWINDQEWATMQGQARRATVNISQLIRTKLLLEPADERRWLGAPMRETVGGTVELPPVHVAPLPAPRPFTPAPKPGKR